MQVIFLIRTGRAMLKLGAFSKPTNPLTAQLRIAQKVKEKMQAMHVRTSMYHPAPAEERSGTFSHESGNAPAERIDVSTYKLNKISYTPCQRKKGVCGVSIFCLQRRNSRATLSHIHCLMKKASQFLILYFDIGDENLLMRSKPLKCPASISLRNLEMRVL